jgi:type I restriction enzyme, S subunit
VLISSEQKVIECFRFLNCAVIAQLQVVCPPKEEQRHIAEILDTLDEAIAHTSSLIAKLKQMKAGLLHDLLTPALDENGELRDAIGHPKQFKDSPLGQIPKDWKFTEFGALIAEGPQNGIYKPESDYADNGVPIVRIDGFYDGVLANQETFRRVRLTKSEIRR